MLVNKKNLFSHNFSGHLESVLIIVLLLYWGKYLFMPLTLAFFTSIFLLPLARLFEKIHIPRSLASALPVILLLLFTAGFLYFFKSELANIISDLPALKLKLKSASDALQQWIESKYKIDIAAQAAFINKQINALLNSPGAGLTGILKLLILPVLFLIFTFYILFYRKMLLEFILSFFEKKDYYKIQGLSSGLQSTINNYIKGLFIEMGVLIIVSYLILLVLGIKYAILMAVLAGLFNVIPYIGIYTAALLNMLITITTGTFHQTFEVFIVFIILHVADANLLMPVIVGNRIKLNPFITLVSVITGELIWGIPGMFLFIPITGTLKIIFERTNDLRPLALLIGKEKM